MPRLLHLDIEHIMAVRPLRQALRHAVRDISSSPAQHIGSPRSHGCRAISTSNSHSADPVSDANPSSSFLQQATVQELTHPDPIYATDDISSLAHSELERHREQRRILRTAAWEMPLLSHLTSSYQHPDKKALPLRWRYTTYMGELHPASRKVVVDFVLSNIAGLNEAQRQKFRKIAGTRYNPQTDTVKMSCESYETQAQNRRYLSDQIKSLLAYTTSSETDSFEDIPLDTRHVKPKKSLQFPTEWRLTAERKRQLEIAREAKLLEEGRRVENGQIVIGQVVVKGSLEAEYETVPLAVGEKKTPIRRIT